MYKWYEYWTLNTLTEKKKLFSYHFHSGNHGNGMRYTIDWLYELCNKEIFQIHLRVFCFSSFVRFLCMLPHTVPCARHLIAAMKFQIRKFYIAMQIAQESNNHICHRYVYQIHFCAFQHIWRLLNLISLQF